MDIWTVNNKCQVSVQLLVEIKHCRTGLKPTCRTHKLNLLNCPCKSSLLILSMLTVDSPPLRIHVDQGLIHADLGLIHVDCWSSLHQLLIHPQDLHRPSWGWSMQIVDPLYIDCQFAPPPRIHADLGLIRTDLGLICMDPGQIYSKMCIVGISWCIMGNPLSSASQLHVGSVCISFVKSWIYEQ